MALLSKLTMMSYQRTQPNNVSVKERRSKKLNGALTTKACFGSCNQGTRSHSYTTGIVMISKRQAERVEKKYSDEGIFKMQMKVLVTNIF